MLQYIILDYNQIKSNTMNKTNSKRTFIFYSSLILMFAAIIAGILLFKSKPLERFKFLDGISTQNLRNGMIEMAKHKLVICGITRDNANALPNVIRHIENTASFFKDYKVIIFENDSSDGTKEILKNWSMKNDKVKILSKDYGFIKRPSIAFMAEARNFYLDELQNNHEYDDYDIVMVADLDFGKGWDARGIADSFSKINDWEAVCSNGSLRPYTNMYDTFAFLNLEPNKCTHNEHFNKCNHTKRYKVDEPLVPVGSCFGGIAFYKREFIKGCRYESHDEDCEHIAFHQCMINKNHGRMFLNPSQFLRY